MGMQHGYTLPQAQPSHEDMEKLRALMKGKERIGLSEAVRILAKYKNKRQ